MAGHKLIFDVKDSCLDRVALNMVERDSNLKLFYMDFYEMKNGAYNKTPDFSLEFVGDQKLRQIHEAIGEVLNGND